MLVQNCVLSVKHKLTNEKKNMEMLGLIQMIPLMMMMMMMMMMMLMLMMMMMMTTMTAPTTTMISSMMTMKFSTVFSFQVV
jgi:hypothetical protein